MSTTFFDIILQNIILSTLLTYHDVSHTLNSIEYAKRLRHELPAAGRAACIAWLEQNHL